MHQYSRANSVKKCESVKPYYFSNLSYLFFFSNNLSICLTLVAKDLKGLNAFMRNRLPVILVNLLRFSGLIKVVKKIR